MADTLNTDELLSYVRKYRKQEFTFDEIRKSLLEQECKEHDVQRAIDSIKREEGKKPENPDATAILVLSIAYAVLTSIAIFALSRSGVSASFFYSPFSTIFGLLDNEITIHWIWAIISSLCCAGALASFISLQFHKVAIRVLYSLPLMILISSVVFFGFSRFVFVAAIAIAAAHFYIVLDVERRKDAYKKVIPRDIAFQSISRCILPALLIIASFVAVVTWEDAAYAEKEVQRIFLSAGFDTGSVETLHSQLKERQLKNTYDVLESVEQSFVIVSKQHLSQACQTQFNDAFSEMDKGIKQQLQENVEKGGVIDPAQIKKLESLTRMVQRMRTTFPLLASVFAFMILEMCKRLIATLASVMVWLLVREHA